MPGCSLRLVRWVPLRPEGDTYTAVLLRSEGARVGQNVSPAAIEIAQWLLDALDFHEALRDEHERFVANDGCHPD